ncbi:MAG: Trigger factor [Dehalococcoidia bacterium]|nr:Trigger factor [Dehalococcoidia bacterium]
MKVTRDTLENSQVVLTVEVEPPEMEEAMTHAYRHLVKRASIPGFRKGKTPRSILENYLGKAAFLEEAIEHAVPEAYNKAVEEQKLDAIARPQIEVTSTEPIRFKATVAVRPTVTLGDYRSIRVQSQATEVTDQEIDRVVERLRKEQATWQPVERAAQLGDLVTVDIKASSGDKTVLDQKGFQLELSQESTFPAAGFADKVAGMSKGEDMEFSLPLQAKAGEEAQESAFKVSLSEVKEGKLSEINDDFVKTLSAGLETLAALRERIASSLKAQAEEKEHLRVQNAFLEEAVKSSTVVYPPVLVDSEIENALNEQARYYQQGRDGLAAYLKNIGKTEAEVREELRPQAASRVVRSLILSKIAEEEKIAVEPAEIEAEIERMLQLNQDKIEERRKFLNQPATRGSIERAIFNRKAVERLEQIARGETLELKAAAESASGVRTESKESIG